LSGQVTLLSLDPTGTSAPVDQEGWGGGRAGMDNDYALPAPGSIHTYIKVKER